MTATLTTTQNEIQQRAGREILCDPHVTTKSLNVEYADGIAILHGVVSNYASKQYAEAAARRVSGIHDVVNQLQVKIPCGEFRADKEISEAVRYIYAWNVFIPQNDIVVTVVDGWVLLDGQVASWMQRQEAEAAIAHLAGVKGIVNDLQVTNI